MAKRILFAAFGSLGDVFPYIGIARALLRRGHRPVIATTDMHRDAIEAEGIEYAPMRPGAAEFGDFSGVAKKLFHPIRGPEFLIGTLVLPYLRQAYEDLKHAASDADLVVSHPLTVTLPMVAEKLGRPWVSTVLSPLSLFSAVDPPVFAPLPWLRALRHLGPGPYRAVFSLIKTAGRQWEHEIAGLRSELGLASPRGPAFFEGQYSPMLNLALFSRLLAEPASDWPANTRTSGFPLYDGKPLDQATAERLSHFMQAGDPPLAFVLGSSAVMIAGHFWEEAIEASRALGRRAILITGRDQPLPDLGNRDDIAVFPYLPYSLVFPYAAAVVHQAGIGTLSQALAARRPQLIVPVAFDQPDNAARSKRLGVARVLPFRRVTAPRLAGELEYLLEDRTLAERAAHTGAQVFEEHGATAAAAALLEL